MKRNVIIITILITIASFAFAIPRFNLRNQLASTYYSYEQGQLHDQYILQIPTFQVEDLQGYLNDLDQAFVDNQLVGYKLVQHQSDALNPRYTLTITSNDMIITNQALVDQGYLDPTNKTSPYSSYATNDQQRISNIFGNFDLTVQNVVFDRQSGGFWYIGTLDDQTTETHVIQLIEQMKSKYPEFSGIYQPMPTGEPMISNRWLPTGLRFRLALIVLLAITLCSKIFTMVKTIAIEKMEGGGIIELYWRHYLKPYLGLSIMVIPLMLLINYLIFPHSRFTLSVWSYYVYQEYGLLTIGMIGLSTLLMIIIRMMPITISIKGKQSLNGIAWMASALKCAIAILWIPTISNGYLSFQDSLMINMRHDHILDGLNQLYTFGVKNATNYDQALGSEQTKSIEQTLVKDNDLFEFMGGYIGDSHDPQRLYPVLFIDQGYILKNKLTDPTTLAAYDQTIFIHEDQTIDQALIDGLTATLSYNPTGDAYRVNIITYDHDLPTYRVSDLAYRDTVDHDQILVYTLSSQSETLNGHIFRYDGSLQQAQQYVDDLFYNQGFNPKFEIDSYASVYEGQYQSHLANNIEFLRDFMILWICYGLTNLFVIDIDIANNKQRYYVAYYEASGVYSGIEYIKKLCSPTIIAVLISMIFASLSMDASGLTIVILMINELLVYGCY